MQLQGFPKVGKILYPATICLELYTCFLAPIVASYRVARIAGQDGLVNKIAASYKFYITVTIVTDQLVYPSYFCFIN